ncbi:MAG: TetR/AcrR family transcriptional regulator [Bacteroidota bacterium]|nr:TetR/AcrR family transcriptional regulator [Bacteroidota bacterium]
MEEKLKSIIKQVLALYLKYGIKSVTMDDVARELGISKKTLYQYVDDKDDLVEKTLNFFNDNDNHEFCKIDDNQNAIDTLLFVSEHVAKKLSEINPSIVYDLRKYYPALWKNFNETKRDHIFSHIKKNIETGIRQGLYRDDFNIDLIGRFYVFRMEMAYHFEYFKTKEYSFEEIFRTMFIYHIRGIANQKGIDYLEKKIREDNLKVSVK